jgi:hydroxymethylbilane synthase
MSDVITSAMDWQDFLPSPGQGAICLETRAGDSLTENLLAPLNHEATALAVSVERAVSKALGASCRMPLGAYARIEGGKLNARATLYSPDGKQSWVEQGEADLSEAEALGQRLGENIKKNADPSLFSEFSI